MTSRLFAGLLAAFLSAAVFAQAAVADNEQKRRLIEQKLKLVEMLVNSPAAKRSPYGREGESPALLEKGLQAIADAKKALAESRFDDAAKLLDDALKSATSASRKMSADGGTLSDSAQRKSLADLGEQVATYRASVVELSQDSRTAAAAKTLLTRIDGLTADAKRLGDAGQLGDANKKLAEAYRLCVEEISKLRAGQEVLLSLKFDTPADEYAYEQKRFASNEIMVDMMIGEGRAAGERRQMVDNFVGEGRKLRDQAGELAKTGKHKEAVAAMEKATGQLNRALQSMGVPVF